MPDEAHLASGKRFAEDLRRLREACGLSVDDLHRETRIPRHLIASFEATSLFENPLFNRVYLRSFVRTYAGLVGAPPEEALDALETALEGRYDDGWAARALEDAGGGTSEGAAADENTADASHTAASPAGERTPDRPPEKSARRKKEAHAQEAEEVTEANAEDAGTQHAASTTETARRAMPGEPPALPAEPAGEAWSAQSPPAGASGQPDAPRRRGKNRPRASSRLNASLLRVGVALAALALVALVLIVFWPAGGDSRSANSAASADTAAAVAETTAAPAAAPLPRAEIGPMMDLVIVGAGGPVQGIRLTRDGDLRRPYWIEEGAATDFPAEERILVEEDAQIAKARLLLEGYAFPKGRRDAQGRIHIDRSTAQAFLDTVRGAPVQLAAAPDTNRIPVPR